MLITLILKEIHESIITFRFFIVTLLCLILVPLGGYVTMKDYVKRNEVYHESVRLYEEQSQGRINANFNAEAYRPPSELSILAIGLEEDLPNKITTSRNGRFELTSQNETDNLLSRFFGKIDYLFIVSYVLSLVAFLFTFNAVSHEKESGTLRLMMSNSVPRWKIIIAKICGNYAVFLAPLIVTQTMLLLIMFTGSEVVFSFDILIKTVVIFIAAYVFLLMMFTIGIFISIWTGRSTTSIMTLLFLWVFFVFVIPKTSPMLAEILYPVKSKQVVSMEIKMATDDIENELNEKRGELLDSVGEEVGVEMNGMIFFGQGDAEKRDEALARYNEIKGPLEQEYEDMKNNSIQNIETDYNNRLSMQTNIARNLARVSPVSCFMFLFSEIAGTGILENENVRENAVSFQNQVEQEIYDQININVYATSDGARIQMPQPREGVDQQKLPVPRLTEYRRATLSEIVTAEWADILLLFLYTILFFMISFVSFIRYDVR
ncbi:ABC transporter permease [Candidatus Latescibacterota bacterium]